MASAAPVREVLRWFFCRSFRVFYRFSIGLLGLFLGFSMISEGFLWLFIGLILGCLKVFLKVFLGLL